MDIGLEANHNSALFSTMLSTLDVYNPLVHKARPMTVNGMKHAIKTEPTNWGNTLSSWNGQKKVRFDVPRIGSLYNFTVQAAIKFPGIAPKVGDASVAKVGWRGQAKPDLTTGGLINTNAASNTARGRLDRIYADKLLGFNMIESYKLMSKSRQIFSATGEYLLMRFMRLDADQKEVILKATTPVSMTAGPDYAFYSPGVTYQMNIPLWFFFNEHITNALDTNFTEEVYIEITLRPPSDLFYYGNLGDLYFATTLQTTFPLQLRDGAVQTWDQSTTEGSYVFNGSNYLPVFPLTISKACYGDAALTNNSTFGTANVGEPSAINANAFTTPIFTAYNNMIQRTMDHIRGVAQPMTSWRKATNVVVADPSAPPRAFPTPEHSEWENYGFTVSGPTFAFPNVDNLGESIQVQFLGQSNFLVQDTDAARALRQQQFPVESGLTQIVYDTAQETWRNLYSDRANHTNTLLDATSGGEFIDPESDPSGISDGSSQHYVDLQLRSNNLVHSTSFMVRKESDFGGDNNATASTTSPLIGRTIPVANKVLGAHRLYTRCLPVHYFEVLSAGRIIYSSNAVTHLDITQAKMYRGTEFGASTAKLSREAYTAMPIQLSLTAGLPFNIYTINWGLQASLLENTGALSLQNLNNPILRIYFKPDAWAEYPTEKNSEGKSEAMVAAAQGVRVDVIHEHFNVITINSGNGEITSGLNQ